MKGDSEYFGDERVDDQDRSDRQIIPLDTALKEIGGLGRF